MLGGCHLVAGREFRMPRISKRSVDALPAGSGRPSFLWDDQLAGFGVKALPSGIKRYLVKYRTHGGGRTAPQRWFTLGTHGNITPDQARDMAQQVLAAVARGEDPQGAKFDKRSAPTLRDVWVRFEAEYLPLKKPATQHEYQSQWIGLIEPKLGKTRVESLSADDVDRFHKSLGATPYRANRTLALLSSLMTLGETWDWRARGTNPCKHIKRFNEKARARFLSLTELERLGLAMKQLTEEGVIVDAEANAIELLLLTGARLNEIVGSKWSWLDAQRGVLNLPDSKTGAKPIYLSAAALEVIGRQPMLADKDGYIFPARSSALHTVNIRRAWDCVRDRAKLSDVRLHDLRHTAASIAVGQGASLAIVGRLLGHSQAQTTLRYAHVDIDPALRAANEIGNVVGQALRASRQENDS